MRTLETSGKTGVERWLSPWQVGNLARLAVFCRDLPKDLRGRLDMSTFGSEHHHARSEPRASHQVDLHQCGTNACYCGFGPLAGIKADADEYWTIYARRCFGVSVERYDTPVWPWLFDPDHCDSMAQAVKRSAWLLEGHEVPESFDVEVDGMPRGFKRFKPDWKRIEEMAAASASQSPTEVGAPR